MIEPLFRHSSSMPLGDKGTHQPVMREFYSPTIIKLDLYSN